MTEMLVILITNVALIVTILLIIAGIICKVTSPPLPEFWIFPGGNKLKNYSNYNTYRIAYVLDNEILDETYINCVDDITAYLYSLEYAKEHNLQFDSIHSTCLIGEYVEYAGKEVKRYDRQEI